MATFLGPLNGPRLPPRSGGKPKQLVVLLHGLGADGNDLIGLAPHWQKLLPDALFVAPNAPEPCDMAPMGYQWFSLRSFAPQAMAEGARQATGTLNRFLDDELQRHGLTDADLALVGFSQGTMMALHVSLRRPQPCAAVVGFSGALVDVGHLAAEKKSEPPIFLVHGDADPVVPIQMLFAAIEGLSALGVACEWHVSPNLPHGIGPDGLALGGQFLEHFLVKRGSKPAGVARVSKG